MKNRKIKKLIAAALAVALAFSAFSSFSVFAEPDDTQPTPTNEGISYTGAEIRPLMNISSGEVQLIEGEDYTVTYENNINVGTATAIITFIGNYSGERRASFNIMPQNIEEGNIRVLPIEKQEYQFSEEIEPEPTVMCGDDTVLVRGTDYEVHYSNNRDIGMASMEISLMGNYMGSLNQTFEIVPREITEEVIESGEIVIEDIGELEYRGVPYDINLNITRNGYPLSRGGEYELSFENNVNVGTATVHIEFRNAYKGNITRTFKIVPYNVDNNDMNNRIMIYPIGEYRYTGQEIKPDVVIVDRERYNY